MMETAISNNTIEKCKKLSEAIGEITCMCGQQLIIAEKGKLIYECPNCLKSIVATMSNRLMALIKQKSNEYYTNRFKCRCGKQYPVNLMTDCCKIKYKPRSNIPFEIHGTCLYIFGFELKNYS